MDEQKRRCKLPFITVSSHGHTHDHQRRREHGGSLVPGRWADQAVFCQQGHCACPGRRQVHAGCESRCQGEVPTCPACLPDRGDLELLWQYCCPEVGDAAEEGNAPWERAEAQGRTDGVLSVNTPRGRGQPREGEAGGAGRGPSGAWAAGAAGGLDI